MQYGFIPNGTQQTVKNYTIYPTDFFYPKYYSTGKTIFTPNSHTIHHFASSWVPWQNKVRARTIKIIKKILGRKITHKIRVLKRLRRIKSLH